jgi:hypothetical protein
MVRIPHWKVSNFLNCVKYELDGKTQGVYITQCEGRRIWDIGCLIKMWVKEQIFDCADQGSQPWWNTAVTWVIISFSTIPAPSLSNTGDRAG